MTERRRDFPARLPWREQHRVTAECTAVAGSVPGPIGLAFQVGVHRTGDARTGASGRPQASFQAVVEVPRLLSDTTDTSDTSADAGAGSADSSRPIVIAADGIVAPAAGWELRTSGLWADHNCETPFEHWSYGLEAFALAVDDRAELLERGYGERTPLGWELDFEAEAEPAAIDEAATGLTGYSQSGLLHGIVQLAHGEIEVEGTAIRWRWWGTGHADRSAVLGAPTSRAVALPTPEGVWWVSPLTHTDAPKPIEPGDGGPEARCDP